MNLTSNKIFFLNKIHLNHQLNFHQKLHISQLMGLDLINNGTKKIYPALYLKNGSSEK